MVEYEVFTLFRNYYFIICLCLAPCFVGSVIVHWSPAVSKDAGEYICSGKGVDANGNPASFTNTIAVVVESNGSSVLGTLK